MYPRYLFILEGSEYRYDDDGSRRGSILLRKEDERALRAGASAFGSDLAPGDRAAPMYATAHTCGPYGGIETRVMARALRSSELRQPG
ncbi:hypothetical protein Tco_1121474 [Tanacetum coccineum]|uniref:Uncharacterized protein n=1 Tax=Tanacetum coccineum TaxID=301880 RepID=A0ABQ5IY05_9ASTR